MADTTRPPERNQTNARGLKKGLNAMRVLVGCEHSGAVRDAFKERGHDAWSCDLLPSESPGNHLQCDVFEALEKYKWDLLICHPPCTHLAVSGARWFPEKVAEQKEALEFVLRLMNVKVRMVCLENPVGVVSRFIRKPTQIIQPWMFGDEAQKTTCLWLKNLPKLKPTRIVGRGKFHTTKSGKKLPAWYNLPPSENRGLLRSKTFAGTAAAMAAQWGRLDPKHEEGLGIVFESGFAEKPKE